MLDKSASWFFKAAAFSNWILCGTGMLLMKQHFLWLGEDVPASLGMHYFVLFLGIYFGFMYWEISRSPSEKVLLMRFGFLAKLTGSVAWAVLLGFKQFPSSSWPAALLSDILWLPFFASFYLKYARRAA